MSFSYKKLLGKGRFAKVYQERFNGLWAAVKLYNEEYPEINDRICQEMQSLKGLNHDNVICFMGIRRVDKDYDGQIAIIMEYCPGGTLLQALRGHRVKEMTQAFAIIHQVASGLAYLHAREVLHRDLKPQNILFRDRKLPDIVIADFGMADYRNYASCMATQLFQPDDETYTKSSDVFSLGLVACCVLVNEAPMGKEHVRTLADKALEMQGCSSSTSSLTNTLQAAISADRYERPSADLFAIEFEVRPKTDKSGKCMIS